MSDKFVIGVKDAQTAEELQRELASLGIQIQRYHPKQVIAFGASIKVGPLGADFTPKEFLELLEGLGPAVVNALFNTLEKFCGRVTLLVNGERKDISQEKMHSVFAAFSKGN